MDTTPLGMQFKEFDTDHDGRITGNEAHELLKLLGKNIYLGTVQYAAKLVNYNNPKIQTFSFEQFQDYYESYETIPRHDIWKAKHQLLFSITQVLDNLEPENATAAPGSHPQEPDEPCEGDIDILIGPSNQNYDSFVEFSLTKEPKAQSKPFIKLIFEQNSNDRAKQLEGKITALHASLVNLIKEMEPDYAPIVQSFNLITNVVDARLNVFITTSNQPLIQLMMLISEYLDRILRCKVEAKLNFKHSFNLDIEKFMEPGSDYTFYHAITKNSHMKLTWSSHNFKESTKQLMKAHKIFEDLKYQSSDPFCLMTMGLIHTNLCQISLAFQNTEFAHSELQSKQQIMSGISWLQDFVKDMETESNIQYKELAQKFDNRLSVQVSLGDWKAQSRIQIKNLNQVILKPLIQND